MPCSQVQKFCNPLKRVPLHYTQKATWWFSSFANLQGLAKSEAPFPEHRAFLLWYRHYDAQFCQISYPLYVSPEILLKRVFRKRFSTLKLTGQYLLFNGVKDIEGINEIPQLFRSGYLSLFARNTALHRWSIS